MPEHGRLVTVDPAGALDLDDAVSVLPLVVVQVAIVAVPPRVRAPPVRVTASLKVVEFSALPKIRFRGPSMSSGALNRFTPVMLRLPAWRKMTLSVRSPIVPKVLLPVMLLTTPVLSTSKPLV